MPNYGDATYWDDRYTQKKESTFDWLEGWDDVKSTLEKYAVDGLYEILEANPTRAENKIEDDGKTVSVEELFHNKNLNIFKPNKTLDVPNFVAIEDENKAAKIRSDLIICNLGCGNSIMCEDMYDEGYQTIYNMDISNVCIEQMTQRNKDIRPRMKFEVMDCTDLKYQNEQFDLIIDKSTIDALVCGDFALLNVAKMMKECQRTLKTGGAYVAISYGCPENRVFHYLQQHLKFSLQSFKIAKTHKETGHPSLHYIYVLKKEPGADQVC